MRQLKISKSITIRDSASLELYLTEISKKEMITVEEETRLAKLIRDGDHEALLKLTTANLRFVVSVAKQYQHQGISLPDLINEGNIGLMKAAKRFDETRGFKFISYAVWWIRQGIIQAVAEQSRLIRLPMNKVGAINKIKKMQASLEQELERQPTAYELSEVLDMPENEVDSIIASSVWHVSTDASMSSDDFKLSDVLQDHNSPSPDATVIADSRQLEIQRSLSTLTERERDIITLFYGINNKNPFTLEEIGMRYELTRERVRQIKEKALRKLRYAAKSKNLRAYLG